jgi:formylglycine-generating enzyme required for sulfatase activity
MMGKPRIFVSHSHTDDGVTERLVADLRQAGADAWMDTTDLGAGNFQQRINDALAECDWFVLVLTRDALASLWVRQEVDAANRLKNQRRIRDLILFQAGPLDHRELPPLWGVYNIFDATEEHNYMPARNRTLAAVGLPPPRTSVPLTPIDTKQSSPPPTATPRPPSPLAQWLPPRLADLSFQAKTVHGSEVIIPPLCEVSAGPFLMGSEPRRDRRAERDERPQHIVTLPAYHIARFPITVGEYACFVRAGHDAPDDWHAQLYELEHPVVNVSWYDALAYAAWLTECTGDRWRLPTEAEWEKAARSADGRTYPWGDTFERSRCNTDESHLDTTSVVGRYPSGASPYGVEDLAGNAGEWTSSRYHPYPYTVTGERETADLTEDRVVRGGSWLFSRGLARAACRIHLAPDNADALRGFRLVQVPASS